MKDYLITLYNLSEALCPQVGDLLIDTLIRRVSIQF